MYIGYSITFHLNIFYTSCCLATKHYYVRPLQIEMDAKQGLHTEDSWAILENASCLAAILENA